MIDISVFKEAIPAIESELLSPEYAAELLDCNLERGSLAPVNSDLLLSDPINSNTQTVYHSGAKLYQWPGLVEIARAFDDIDSRRILFTDGAYPKETDAALGETGAGPWPAATRRNGLPAPEASLGISMGGTAGEDEKGRYSWVYTYYYLRPDGSVIESAPSPPTAVVTWWDGETVTLTGFSYPDPAVPGCSYTGIRIYRLQATESGASYHFIRQQTTLGNWEDIVTDIEASVNAILETMDISTGSPVSWDKPVDGLRGITNVDAGFFAGFFGNKIYLSALFVPYAFPGKYSLSTDSFIKGIGYTGSVIVVLTEANPYILIGLDPASVSLKRLNYSRPCIGGHRSIVSTPGGVLFPSTEGLCLIDPTGADPIVTKNVFTVDQWNALNPENFISFLYQGKFVAFESGTKNIHIIDITNGRYSKGQATGNIRAAYQAEDSSINIVVDNTSGRELRQWRGGTAKTYSWTSKIFDLGTKSFYARGVVRGDFSGGKTLTLTIKADGADRTPITITSEGMFNTGRFMANTVQAKLSGTAKIKRLILGGSPREVLNV